LPHPGIKIGRRLEFAPKAEQVFSLRPQTHYAETINAKYKGVSGEPMTPAEVAAWKKIGELASRFRRADRILMGAPMWNFSFPHKLKQLIDLVCQRNMLFTFDGKRCGPSLDIEKAFVAFVRGQSDEAGFERVPQPGFQYLSGYVEFWLRFIGVREVVTLTLEHTWDGRAVDMIAAGKKKAAELAKQASSWAGSGTGGWRFFVSRLPGGRR
jgi:FMN-dependent NADH-azoreductase